jgi:hypothetical protein
MLSDALAVVLVAGTVELMGVLAMALMIVSSELSYQT